MERRRSSVAKTPLNSPGVQRRSKNKTYRQSYRSCLSAGSHLCITPGLTRKRLLTSRKAAKSFNISKERVNPEQLALLLKTEWQLSYVTPLYRFRHSQLNTYSRQLSAFLAAEKQQGLAVDVEGMQSSYKVSLSVVEGMVETEDDAETIFIEINSKPVFARRDGPQTVLWRGWLTCISDNPGYQQLIPKDFVCLPLFGSNGAENLTTMVKSWFQKTFDCCFGPLEISHTSLQWLVALWTNCHTESSIKELKMIWNVPVMPPLQVTYIVNPQDAWELWNTVRNVPRRNSRGKDDEDGENVDIEEVMKFMKGLKSHFYRHFRLDLSAGSLSQVSTALGTAKSSGRIKILNSKYMITTLMLLTECALLKMPV